MNVLHKGYSGISESTDRSGWSLEEKSGGVGIQGPR